MPADISFITYFGQILAFLLVAFVVGAILGMSKILGESKWVQSLVALFVASIFVASAGARDYVLSVVPWVIVLVLALFFILLIFGFIGKDADFMKKGIGITVLIALGLIFLITAFVVFSEVLVGYLPGPGFGSGDTGLGGLVFFDWLYSARVGGAILLLVASALVAWVLVKGK